MSSDGNYQSLCTESAVPKSVAPLHAVPFSSKLHRTPRLLTEDEVDPNSIDSQGNAPVSMSYMGTAGIIIGRELSG